LAFIAVNSVTSVVHSLSQKEGDSGLRHRLLWKLLAIHVLLIAFVILLVWLAVDYLAAGYLAALMKEYNVSPTTTHRMFIHAVHRYLIWASLAALGLAVTSSFLLLRKVLSPLTRMMDITKKIARGDYAAKVPIESRDEVGQLARAFNQMAESLGKVEQLRKTMVLDVAHELRTPLTNMKGYLEALLDGVLPPSRQNLELLQEETGRLVRLVEDLLRLAKADAARATLHKSPIPIHELIARELDSFLPRFQARQISVETHFHPAIDWVGGDSDKLVQVVGNLLENAWHYTPPGGTARVSTEPFAGGVKIVFSNPASEISENDLPFIFERFYRGEKSRSRDHGGAGIGLAIVKELVEAHDGQVGAEIAAGEIRIWFSLPF
jgi:two-component system, OmpR family, sensor histidine kinase BaeS